MLPLDFYPTISLAKARQEHTRFKEVLAQDIDPYDNHKEQKRRQAMAATNSFESIARFDGIIGNMTKLNTMRLTQFGGRGYILSLFINKPINEITAAQFMAMCERLNHVAL